MPKKFRFDSVESCAKALAAGEMLIMVDDERRENEGDIVIAAGKATAGQLNFMVKEARGLVCVPITKEKADEEMRTENERLKKEKDIADVKLKTANETAAKLQARIKAKADAEAKAKAESEQQAEALAGMGDKDKFATWLKDLEHLKNTCVFKSKKYQKLQAEVNGLIDKIIFFANSKF